MLALLLVPVFLDGFFNIRKLVSFLFEPIPKFSIVTLKVYFKAVVSG